MRLAGFSCFLLLVCAAAGLCAPARQKELKRIREQLEEKKKEVESFQKLQAQTEKDISVLLDEKQKTHRLLREIKGRKQEAAQRETRFSQWLSSLRSAKDVGRRALAEEVLGYSRQVGSREALYGRQDIWREAFRRSAMRGRVRLLGGMGKTESMTAGLREEARRQEVRLHEKETRTEAEIERQEGLYRRKQDIARETGEKVSRTLREMQELEESAKALASMIKDMERKRTVSARGVRVQSVPRHSLPWPAEGKVVGFFGRARVEELDTWTIQNGIKIAVPSGSAVRPVAKGKVLFAGPFRSYGNVVVVDHEGGFYAVYGQLDRVRSRKGDLVSVQTELASVSATAGSKAVLYFEVREGQSAVDPLPLLK
ncbi:MAG: peptidoglycan DD-metalloendopeptidase family protein [Elusimicrobiota bacterium]